MGYRLASAVLIGLAVFLFGDTARSMFAPTPVYTFGQMAVAPTSGAPVGMSTPNVQYVLPNTSAPLSGSHAALYAAGAAAVVAMLYVAGSTTEKNTSAKRTAAAPAARTSQLQMKTEYRIAPSILSADFAKLGEEVENVLASGADVVHFDVMDNHFVPNLTIGPMVCKALKNYGIKAPIDVHLMVSPVDAIIQDFADAGADFITFHPEATLHIDRSLSLIRSKGCKSGLVFNPSTSLDCLKYVMDKVDIILLMSVNPGFGGQAFIPGTLEKAREARKMIDESGYDISLEIDGGVGVGNIKEIAEAGVDMFVAGSAIFNSDDYKVTIDAMRKELADAKI